MDRWIDKMLNKSSSSSLVIASLRTEYSRNCVDFAHAPQLKAGSVCTSKIGLLKSIGKKHLWLV